MKVIILILLITIQFNSSFGQGEIYNLSEALENPMKVKKLVLSALNFDKEQRKIYKKLDFGCFENLESLEISHSKINILPKGICNLSKLRYINLTQNKFKSFPKELLSIKTLEEINLNENSITDFPYEVSNLPNLKTLSLYGNQIKSLENSGNQSYSLFELIISGNPISKESNFLSSFPNLKKLEIGSYDISTTNYMNTISANDLKELKMLGLSLSKNTENLPKFVFELPNLVELNVSSNGVINFDLIASPYKNKRQPSRLRMNGGVLQGITNNISNMTGLRFLDISQNCIFKFPEELYNLNNLEEIDISGTKLSEKDIEKLKERMPDCKITNTLSDVVIDCSRYSKFLTRD